MHQRTDTRITGINQQQKCNIKKGKESLVDF